MLSESRQEKRKVADRLNHELSVQRIVLDPSNRQMYVREACPHGQTRPERGSAKISLVVDSADIPHHVG